MNQAAAVAIEPEVRFKGGVGEPPADSLIPALYHALNEQTTDAIICMRLTGTILLWNKAAEHLYGYTAAEMVGRHISEIVPLDRIQELSLANAKLLLGQHPDHFHTQRMRKDDTKLYVDVSVVPIHNETGAVVADLDIARDITNEVDLGENATNHKMALERELASLQEVLARVTAVRVKVEDWTVNCYSGESNSAPNKTRRDLSASFALWSRMWNQWTHTPRGRTPAATQ